MNCNITEIYNAYHRELKHYFMKYTHSAMKAEDMSQDLFIRLMDYQDMILHDTIRSFVFTIARRMVIDDARHQEFVRRATKAYLLRQADNMFWNDSDTLECRQLKEMELAVVQTLPERMAKVYSMTRFKDKTSDELAQELHISKRTVEAHLFVSRRHVRQALRRAIGM